MRQPAAMPNPLVLARWLLLPFLLGGAGARVGQAAEPRVPAGTKVILVTGSTDGLGREVALRLAATGAHLIIHGRNAERGEAVVRQIQALGKGGARFYAADFASLAAVDQFAAAVRRDYDRLDVLVNNAGIWLTGDRRQLSADGLEMHFAVNYLAGYRLTRLLLPLLEAATPSRIVNVASGSQQPLDFDDLQLTRNYSDSRGYATSKLAQVIFTFDLARELENRHIAVVALHPATLMPTAMVQTHGIAPVESLEQGAAAVVNLATAPNSPSGVFFNGLRRAEPNAQAADPYARSQLRRASEALVARTPAGK
jgi:NAD(P)-dependent dehydrogenase (short-subunit alcohol dehydrogenase family)